MANITYLKNSEINKSKWDYCIAMSENGLIYSTSIFLDNMATNWDALVLDDYLAVMPLPFRKKYDIFYIYPPPFSQQIGITGTIKITDDLIHHFLKNIPAKFRYVEMNFNTANICILKNEKQRNNYYLSLAPLFEILQKGFSRSALRNVKKAVDENITVQENIATEEIIQMHRHRFHDKVGANTEDYSRLQKLFLNLQSSGMLFTIGAFNLDKKLIAGSIYFAYKNRITFIINGNTNESLQNGATHLLMHNTIKKYSGNDCILDFEGSDFEDFVRFYKQYGAIAETYKLIKINRLPWPISLLKK